MRVCYREFGHTLTEVPLMKRLLVPAALLLFVGVSAYAAARTVPAAPECPPTPSCPYMDERCQAAHDSCPMTKAQCEQAGMKDCCRRPCCPKAGQAGADRR